jgi:CheY-like chemotaxis protein
MAHILLVEDNPGALAATSLVLKNAGHRLTTATSVAEAAACTPHQPRPGPRHYRLSPFRRRRGEAHEVRKPARHVGCEVLSHLECKIGVASADPEIRPAGR